MKFSMTDYNQARESMVDTQVRPSDVTRFSVIEAMLSTRRELYVPEHLKDIAYSETNIRVSKNRFVLEPRTIAKMLELADIKNYEIVLDIACGLGYSTSLIAKIAQLVIGVEEPELASKAEKVIAQESIDNAIVHSSDINSGANEFGPYDIALIQGGVEFVPTTVAQQVKLGGRLVAIFMNGSVGECCIGIRRETGVDWRGAFNANAPLLTEFTKSKSFIF